MFNKILKRCFTYDSTEGTCEKNYLSRSHDIRSRAHDIRSFAHDIRSRAHDIRSRFYDIIISFS